MAILSGFYTFADVSGAEPLVLYDPKAVYNCPMMLARITAYSFLSQTDIADVYGSCEPNPCLVDMQISANLTSRGYWTAGPKSQFEDFLPGVYTVVGGDEWGALVVLHFTVSREG